MNQRIQSLNDPIEKRQINGCCVIPEMHEITQIDHKGIELINNT